MPRDCARPPLARFVCASVADACQVPLGQLDLDTPLATLNMDSLTLLSVVTRLEAVYGVSVPSDVTLRLFEADTVADIVAELESLEHISTPAFNIQST